MYIFSSAVFLAIAVVIVKAPFLMGGEGELKESGFSPGK